jgi:(heptosyl)LPS beta-1,4-glucosyltransferase
MTKISAVINTLNEEKNIKRCLNSLKFVDEIVVVDMESEDKTREIVYKFTSHVYTHPKINFVEPARNFAIKKATGNWILIVDPDEEIPNNLARRLIEIADQDQADFVRIPRKNIIFNKWLEYSRWWPDYNVRFFKKGKVVWQNAIHSVPITYGKGITLEDQEKLAIIHHSYNTLDQYLKRSLRYTDVQFKELSQEGYKFSPSDIINKPLSEFLSRFFAGEGYKDGLHGLVLALLQSFFILIIYLKLWQEQGFKEVPQAKFYQLWWKIIKNKSREFKFWEYTSKIHLSNSKYRRLLFKIRRKFNL